MKTIKDIATIIYNTWYDNSDKRCKRNNASCIECIFLENCYLYSIAFNTCLKAGEYH